MHSLTNTQDGAKIYVNLIDSPAALHIGHQPHLLTLAARLLKGSAVSGANPVLECDFGRTIGNTNIVETTGKDIIIYAKQLKQTTYSRFVKRRSLDTSTYLTVHLVADADDNYELRDVYVGRSAPPVPGSDDETTASKSYWLTHALVLENQQLQHRTLTKVSPY